MAFGVPHTFEYLAPKFRIKMLYVLKQLEEVSQKVEVFATLVDPWEQAKMWMKSRSEREIELAIRKLEDENALWLVELMKNLHRPYGRWETNDLPGVAWHQWGEAASIRVLSDSGRVVWSPKSPGYKVLAEAARRVGLTSGFYWRHRDVVHIQLRSDAVRAYYTWSEIDQLMKEKFNGLVATDLAPGAGGVSAGRH